MRLRFCGLLVSALGLPPAAALAQAPAAAPAAAPIPAAQLVREGIALHDEGKYDEAAARYRQVLPGDSAYAYAQSELALSLMLAEQYQPSLEAAQRALAREKFEPVTYATLADDYEGLKQYPQARQTYAEGLKLFPYNENLWINQGILELNQKQLAPALASLERAAELRPGKASVHRLLGKAAAQQGQLTHTLISWATYLLLDPTGERSQSVLVELERLSVGVPLVEPGEQLAAVAPNQDFEELDQLIAAKVALTPGYVSKVKFKAAIVRQLQLVVEKFPVDANPAGDFWVRMYAPLVRALRQGDNLTTFTYYILSSANDKSALQWVKSNKAKVEALGQALTEPLLSIRNQQPLVGVGAPKLEAAWFGEGGVLDGIGPGTLGTGDQGVLPTGNWVFVGKDGSVLERGSFDAAHKRTGKWTTYRPDGTIATEDSYANGELDGVLRRYHPGGQVREESTYRAGKVEGVMKIYAEDGRPVGIRPVAKGDFEGESVDYYPDKTVSYRSMMHADVRDGALERYYPDGTVRQHEQYAQGKAQGEQLDYYPDKTLKQKITFVQDEPSGPFTSYFPNGQVREAGQFSKGKRSGTWKEYFSNGKLSVEKSYDEVGELHGPYHDYDYQGRHYSDSQYEHGRLTRATSLDPATGKPRTGADYVLKKARTPLKSYDAQGRLLAAGDVENGQLVGEWKDYYPDGTVREVRRYDHGIRTGASESYYATGQLYQRRSYNAQGQPEGLLEQFSLDGQLRQRGYERDGEDVGTWQQYYPGGQLSQEREIYHEQLSGPVRSLSVAGQPTDELRYLYGELKQLTYRDSTGRVVNEQTVTPATRELVQYIPGLPGQQVLNRSAVSNGTYDGAVQWFWPGGQPEATFALRDGSRYGPFRRYYPGGQPAEESAFLDGKRHGPSTQYYLSGQPSTKGRYLDGEQVGEWTSYYPDGQVQRQEHYNDEGEADGPTRYYNPAGELLLELRYEQGHLVSWAGPGSAPGTPGPAQALPPAGGPIKATFANGKPAADLTMAHGYPSGTSTYYYASGQVFRRESYQQGLLSGLATSYYPSGKPMREENYLHGELHGRCRYYRPDGTLEREQTYRVGERSGPWVYYDAQGKPQHRYAFWNDQVYSGQ